MSSLAVSAILGTVGGLLLTVRLLFHEKRSPARSALAWFLLAGAAECLVVALMMLPSVSGTIGLDLHRGRLLFAVVWSAALLRFSLVYGRGDHLELLKKWRIALWSVFIIPSLVVVAAWRTTARFVYLDGDPLRPFLFLGTGGRVANLVVITLGILVLMNLERTLRVAVGTMRWRIKYTLLGVGIFVVTRVFTSSQELLHATVVLQWLTLDTLAFVLCCALLAFSRRRGTLLAVDLYPSQRVIYHSVTLGLAGLYLLIIGALAVAGNRLGIGTWLPLNSLLILLAMVGVAYVLMSDRIRQRAKQWASANFLRPRHDYRRVWSGFTNQAGAVAEVGPFCRAVSELVSETFETLSVSLWLMQRDGRRLALGASSQLAAGETSPLLSPEVTTAVREGLGEGREPVDLNQRRDPWCRALLDANPESFHTGQTLCMPLWDGRRLAGLLVAGDRVNHAPFSTEDRVLLRTIGEHTAAGLVTFRLSEGWAEAREFAALQKASAFFAHDLKNTATTLKLMLGNLSRHFDNAEFRQDALQTIASTVSRIEGMISELSSLRSEQALRIEPTDLNGLVGTVLDDLAGEASCVLETKPGDLPPVPLDAQGVRTVLTNLVANARDAGGDGTRVEVCTACESGQAVVTVRDDGPGMTREFIDTRLFRPFQSTKKDGLGIGLFHARQIVDAHGGHIEVESEPGTGAVFRVVFPLDRAG